MKFTLVQSEIEQAVKDYIGKVITVNPGATVTVDLRNTRGTDGITAEIDVSLVAASPVSTVGQASVAPAEPVKREAVAPAPAKPAAPVTQAPKEPVAEAIGQTPVQEPELPNEDDVPLVEEPGNEEAPVAGKSIFG